MSRVVIFFLTHTVKLPCAWLSQDIAGTGLAAQKWTKQWVCRDNGDRWHK